MIINASGRTDIVAFYTKWFLNRIESGYVDVRNPYYPSQVSRIDLSPDNIDLIVFCTKNPTPIVKHIEKLRDYSLLFQITITPYLKDLEPFVNPKGTIIKSLIELSKKLGKERIFLRYDPIIINDKYTVEYHEKQFSKLLKITSPYISKIIISFVDIKKNIIKNNRQIDINEINEETINVLAEKLGNIAKKYNISIQTCAESQNLQKYGFVNEGCLSGNTVYKLSKKTTGLKRSTNRKNCKCIQSVDIGAYNSCKHYCKYCYANYDERKVLKNVNAHNENSTMLIGKIEANDTIIIRK